jgi:cobalamin biosynthesis Co2+ chelatase CbiK
VREKAILVVSFGTSYQGTRERTIGAIEKRIQGEFPESKVYRAFTSEYIKKKLEKQGTHIPDIKEALSQIIGEGRTNQLIVQPTYIINGTEYKKVQQEIMPYLEQFREVRFGSPLLSRTIDYKKLADILKEAYPVEQGEALVLMGHGSSYQSNFVYSNFERVLREKGYRNIYIGTMKGKPSFDDVRKQLKQSKIKHVCLASMMIVAGKHVNRDMIEGENSWKAQLEQDKYQVRFYKKALGELQGVQNMFLEHIREAECMYRK